MVDQGFVNTMDESFFSALRALVVFVRAGAGPREREARWFEKLLEHEGLDESHRKILRADLERPPALAEVVLEIRHAGDLDRLVQWARTVVDVDREVTPEENRLLAELLRLEKLWLEREHARRSASREYTPLADFVIESSDRAAMWKEIAGKARSFMKDIPARHRPVWMYFVPRTGNFLLYGFILMMFGIFGTVGLSRRRMGQTREMVLEKMRTICARQGGCGDALENSDACVERAWLIGATRGRYTGNVSRTGGFQTDIYAACLEKRAKVPLGLPKFFERELVR